MSAYTSNALAVQQRASDANPLIPGQQTSINPLAAHTAQNPITGSQHVSHNPLTQGQDVQHQQQQHSSMNPLASNNSTSTTGQSMNPLSAHNNSTQMDNTQHHSMNPLASHHNNTHSGSHMPTAATAAATGVAAAAQSSHNQQQPHHSFNPLHHNSNKDVNAVQHQNTHHSMNPLHHKTEMAAGAAAHHHNNSVGHPAKSHWWNRRAKMGRVEFGVREALSMLLVLATMALTIWMMSIRRWASVPTVSGGTAHIGLRSDRITQPAGVASGAQVDNTILAGGANFRRGGTAVIILGSLALLCATLSILMFLCSLCRRANVRGAVALRRFTIMMVFFASALMTLAFLIYSYYLSSDFAFIVFALCSFLFTLAGLGLLAGAPDSVLHSRHSMMPGSSAKNLATTQPNTAANSPRQYNNTAQMV